MRPLRSAALLLPMLLASAVCAVWLTAAVPAPVPAPGPAQAIPLERATTAVQLSDPALSLELVAAEPLVESPVAMTFDEHGRLFVVEMIDYPHDRETHPGRISVLEDTTGDGRYDSSRVFADDLPWPSGAFPYDGGLFVTASPDLLYLKDTTGDGTADLRQVVYTGFGNTVPEPMPDMVVNGLAWGLDNRIYGATSRNGGQVSAPGARRTVDLRGRDFSLDPRTLALRAESGGGQFGVTFDDYGRRFVSSNANHLLMVMYDQRYTARNPYVDYPRPLLDIPEDGPSAPVFRISPDEPWRVLRTQWRASGKVRGLVEHGGRAGGYFTSACSAFVYRGDALPSAYQGSVLVAEPANNLAHRKVLVPDGIPFKGVRPAQDAGTEFLRSQSLWFRPVNFATGPDGALYVVDMHRAVVEDPKTIPADIVKHLDVRAGSRHGRIYRVTRRGFTPPAWPRLADADGPALAEALAHPNGWVRDTAARLLYQRQDGTTVAVLTRLVASAPGGPTRLLALYALRGLDRLNPEHVARALGDADPGVREHGVRLAEAFVHDEDLRREVLALATDSSPRVRYQLAFTLGALPFDAEVLAAMEALLGRDGDDIWMRTAMLTTLSHPVVPILQRLAGMPGWSASPGGSAFLGHVLTTIGARGQPAEMAAAVSLLAGTGDEHARLTLARDFFSGLSRGDVPLPRADPDGRLSATLQAASRRATDRTTDERVRVTALQLLAQDPRVSHEPFLGVLGPAEPQQVQTTAMAALRRRDAPDIAPAILARWGALTPRVRQDALGLLLARPDRALALLGAVRDGTVQRSDLSAGQAQSLLSHADPRVSATADEVLERAVADRVQVVRSYRPALEMSGDQTRGGAVFADACAACHRLDDVGVDIGPNLLGVQHHGKEGLLIAILDPNRNVDPAYLFYEVETRAGDTLQGAITAESAEALTVTQAFGRTQVVPRDQILQMRSLGTSMMPEGLEATLTHEQMADLLEFLLTR